jgi:hypothetical protein
MARGVSENFVKDWKKRLEHANRVYQKNAIIRPGSQVNAKPFAVDSVNNQLAQYIGAYRGDSWADSWGGIPEEELSVTPTFFSIANTFVAGLFARSPEPEVLPRIAEKAENARVWEAVLKYDVDELKMKRQWNYAIYDAFFAGFGFVLHGFTPSEEFSAKNDDLLEKYAMARPDKPWIRRVPPWDVRIDPLACSLLPDEDAEWFAYRQLMCLDDIEQNPNMTAFKNMPTVKLQLAEGGEEPEEFVPVWTFYEKCERTWFQMVEGEDRRLVRQPSDWPLPWEDLPYDICQFNPQMDSQFPVPYAQIIYPSVIHRNKLRTLTEELQKRLRRIILVREDALQEDSRRKIQNADLTEILFVTGDLSQVVAQIQVGGADPSMIAYDGLLEKDIREALGQSAMERGQRINVESGTEAANVAQGGMINASRNVEAVEDFLASSMRHYAIARQATTISEETVPIVGMADSALINGQRGEVRVDASVLAGEYDFKVRAGSTLPETRDKRTREALADIGVMTQAPQIHNLQEGFAAYWQARGKNPAKVMLDTQQMQQTGAAAPAVGEQTGGEQIPNLLSALQQGGGQTVQ